jgi:hypothetical protein
LERLSIFDSKPYQFQIYDDRLNRRTLKAKFLERYDMEDLHDRYARYRLLHLGSMFGTSKFRLKKQENLKTRKAVRERMTIENPVLIDVARGIASSDELCGPMGNTWLCM